MNILYDEEKEQVEKYTYTVNQGGDLDIRVSNGSNRHVTIIFVNGELKSVDHNLGDFNLRSNWHVYGAIAEKIVYLEDSYKRVSHG